MNKAISNSTVPSGNLVLRTLAMPEHKNANGHIFGGWIMSQIDLAGGILASEIANANIVTACVNKINFYQPALVGDIICCYASCLKTGTTSITLSIEVWVKRLIIGELAQRQKISDAQFVYVAIDESARPKSLPINAQNFNAEIDNITQLNLSACSL